MKKTIIFLFTIGLIFAVKYCSSYAPVSQYGQEDGLKYELSEKGYKFFSPNDCLIFGNQNMDSYQNLQNGTFIIKGQYGDFLYTPQDDHLEGPYSAIKLSQNGYLIKDINGWGMLNLDLEYVIPTEHTEAEILQLLK